MYENLLLETWHDVKKLFIDGARTRNTASWRKLNIPFCNATLMPRECELMCKLVLDKENTVSGAIYHLYKLDVDGSVSYVAPKQKDS